MTKEGEKYWVGQIAQKAIIEKDGKVLIQRSPLHTNWDLPGGRLNVSESLKEGLLREVHEELGVSVHLKNVVAVYPYYIEGQGDHIFITYMAQLENPTQEFVLEEIEVAETKWISPDEFDAESMWEGVRPALEIYFKISDK